METRECFVQMDRLMPIVRERLADGQKIRFSPRGTSMLPMLRQGVDSVVLSPLPKILRKYDLPLYQRTNGQYVLHRIITAEDTYTCIGDNQFVSEPGVEYSQMIALVTAFCRGDRQYTVHDLRYRIYCRFWHYTRPLRRYWRRGKAWIRRHLP